MTDEQEIARIMELRGQGLNAEQIGKKLFFSGAAIRKKVRKAGLSEQYHKMSGKSVLEMNRDDIREMIESGAKFSEIMSKYGVSKTTVAQWRKALGIPPRPLGGGNSLHLDGEELARLWNDGKSYTEIGKIVGAASQTVKNNLIRNGTIPKPCKKIRFPESQEEIAKLRKMFDGELKTVELAEKLGVGISTVSSWRRRLGIKNTGRGRMSVRVALGAAADIIGVSAAEYSAKENGRMPITREEYHNILMPLFEAIKAISEGKRCGQCRYYRESGYYSTQGSCYWKSGATEVGVSKKACVRWKPRVDSTFRFSKDERKPVVIEQIRNCGECCHDFNAIRECRFSSVACLNISGSVTEYCSNCENEVTMNWDIKKQGYEAFCPVCGKRLMLCSECLDAEDNAHGMCDYDSDTDSCFRRKGDQE